MRRLTALAVVLGVFGGMAFPAIAHTWNDSPHNYTDDKFYIETNAGTDSNGAPCRDFPFNDSNFYYRGKNAASEISDTVSGSAFDFIYTSPQPCVDNDATGYSHVPYGRVYMGEHWESAWNWTSATSYKALGYAWAQIWWSPGTNDRAWVAINDDNQIPWWESASSSGIGSTQFDVQGVMTHELTHVLGYGHASNTYCDWLFGSFYTMCASVASWAGHTAGRTLDSHEESHIGSDY